MENKVPIVYLSNNKQNIWHEFGNDRSNNMQQIQKKLCTSQVAFSEVLSTKRLIKTTVKVFVKNDTTIIL